MAKNRDPMSMRHSESRAPAREQQLGRNLSQYDAQLQQDAEYYGDDQKSFLTQGPP